MQPWMMPLVRFLAGPVLIAGLVALAVGTLATFMDGQTAKGAVLAVLFVVALQIHRRINALLKNGR